MGSQRKWMAVRSKGIISGGWSLGFFCQAPFSLIVCRLRQALVFTSAALHRTSFHHLISIEVSSTLYLRHALSFVAFLFFFFLFFWVLKSLYRAFRTYFLSVWPNLICPVMQYFHFVLLLFLAISQCCPIVLYVTKFLHLIASLEPLSKWSTFDSPLN